VKKIIYIGVVLLFNKRLEVLFQLRDNKKNISNPNKWTFPGGHKKTNETIKSCALREFKEETNYKADNINFITNIFLKKKNKKLFFYYTFYDEKQKLICLEGQKIKFFNLKDIVGLKTPYYTKIIFKKTLSMILNNNNEML
jgi:8-oxo-dGTP pyrophosphatase MutT (NUDIX family)